MADPVIDKETRMPATPTATTALSRADAEDLLFKEAWLIDSRQLDAWLDLFAPDALYWIPIDEDADPATCASLIRDGTLRREERVHHLLHDVYPAQSPPSRTQHVVSNVMVEPAAGGTLVRSNQVIYEMRTGDFAQVGLGQVASLVARVEHLYVPVGGAMKIASKKILLIDRDSWQGNLTFLL